MNDLFYLLSKLIWLLISPDSLLLIWFLVGVMFLWLGSLSGQNDYWNRYCLCRY